MEAGLRGGDMKMPEEINRLVTDRLADLLLVPDKLSIEKLKSEGVPDSKIKFVGNIMIDTLEENREKASKLDMNEIIQKNPMSPSLLVSLSVNSPYALMTLHRPSNVDDKNILEAKTQFITNEVTKEIPLVGSSTRRKTIEKI